MADLPPGFDNLRPLLADELGITYQARQTEFGRDVALRVLNLTVPGRSARRQFRGACLTVTALTDQRSVLGLHDVEFTAEHHPYLVTDPLAGTLASRLARGPLPAPVAASMGVALADCLDGAHKQGVLHLDVRPENVVRTAAAPGPLLANFGVSRAVSAAGQAELPVECLLHAGRELFGWDTPGPPADVYGLASTIYAMLAGQAPYAGEARLGRAALYQRVLRGAPPAIARPGIPQRLTALIAEMMDPDPSSRPGLAEVREILGQHTGVQETSRWWEVIGEPASAGPAFTGSATTGPASTGPTMAAGAVMAGALPSTRELAPATPAPAAPAPATPALAAPALAAPAPSPPAPAPRAPSPAAPRPRHTGLILLVAAGVVALLAGVIWGLVTGPAPRPPRVSGTPTVRATASATPVPASALPAYRATHVKVTTRSGGALVTWATPRRSTGVTAYLVTAELVGQAVQERPVDLRTHSAVFASLVAGQRYCFLVTTLVESASGQPSTATTRPVCTTIKPARQRRARVRRAGHARAA